MTSAMTHGEVERHWPEWTLGDRLAKSRKDAEISQIVMGELLAEFNKGGKPYSHSTIGAWENDKNQPRRFVPIVIRWGEITNVAPEWLLPLRPQLSLVPDSGTTQISLFAADFGDAAQAEAPRYTLHSVQG